MRILTRHFSAVFNAFKTKENFIVRSFLFYSNYKRVWK